MNTQTQPLNIAIVAYNLDIGGLANVIKNVFDLLSNDRNFNVKLFLLDDKQLIENENIVSFGGNYSFFQKINKYLRFKESINNDNWDFIIDLRYRLNPFTEILITKFIYPKTKIIYNVHSSKLETYLLKNKWLTNWLYGNSYKMVCGAKGNEDLVVETYNLQNTITIYNPLNLEDIKNKSIDEIQLNYDFIIAVGRVEEVKQFEKLIEAYSHSILPKNNCKLVIVGSGSELEKCKKIAKNLEIDENVVFVGHQSNPYKYMKRAKFFVLSSKYEGFGIALAESLVCGTPVISFDLQTGPNEIIVDRKNGLLVENQNFEKLTEAINEMYNDKELQIKCRENAYKSVLKFSQNLIKEKWIQLFNNEL